MVFKLISFKDIRPPLVVTRLFSLTIKEDESKQCDALLQQINDSRILLDADLPVELTQLLTAGGFAWLEQFHARLSLELERQEGVLSFFAWFRPLFRAFYEQRIIARQSITENQTALKQLKQTLKNRLLILLDQKRHRENTLAPEIVLSFEKWLMAYYPDIILPALSLSHTYIPQNYDPILSPVTALQHLTDVQTHFKQLKTDYPLTPLSQFSLKTIFNTFKEEIKRPGYGIKKIPILITGGLSAYLGLPTMLTLGIFFYALFRNTTLALWDASFSVYEHLQWGWKKLAREDQLTHLIHFGPYLLQLEDTAIFTRDWLATGPLDLATLETHFYEYAINKRLYTLTQSLTELKTLAETAHHLSNGKIYETLSNQVEQATERLIETTEAFAHRISCQAKIAFRLPESVDLKPRVSPEQVHNLRDFVERFGTENSLKIFDKNTNAIQLFLNILSNQTDHSCLTLPFATPKDQRTILPFGTHHVNKIALGLNKHFVLKYETSPLKAIVFKEIIRVLKGKRKATKAQIQDYLQTLGAAAINDTLYQIGHHLFLTQDSFTASEIEYFTKEDKQKVINWYKDYPKSIRLCLSSLWGWFESKITFSPQFAGNASLVLKGHAIYQQIRLKEPIITIAQAQEKLMRLAATFKGEHLGFLSFIFSFWDNAPPRSLLDACLEKRLTYALDHPNHEEQTILIDDLSLHLPSPRLQMLSLWVQKKLAGDEAYSENIEKNILIPLSQKGFINEETVTRYRRKALNELLSC